MVSHSSGALGRALSAGAGGTGTLPYPDRFHAAALYAGFAPTSPLTTRSTSTNFNDDTALLLYALYQQATVGPCNIAKPWSWNVVEYAKWTSWNQLAKMPSAEAMRLFVRTLEEEDPDWLKKAQDENSATGDQNPEWWSKAHDEEISVNNEVIPPATSKNVDPEQSEEPKPGESENSLVDKTVSASSNGAVPLNEPEKTPHDAGLGEPGTSILYDQWVSPTILGRKPAARYQHAAAVVGKKMIVIGGNHNGRYLNDVQELDLEAFKWSRVEQRASTSSSALPFPPCAGHSVVQWDRKLLMVAGHSKESSDEVTVRCFDPDTSSWSILSPYGKAPVARGGQTVTKMGNNLIMFGGEDSKRRLYNDLNILDLESMTWEAVETGGTPPSPRSDHTAAVHDDRYFFVFGGGSHSSCFNDLHVLDFEKMEWSQPQQQGFVPPARAGHAAVTIGDNWYIIGGGDNKAGISDTLVLNMSTLVWHVIATEQGRTPIASEGLSVVVSSLAHAEDYLISFGGYNGRYSNEVHMFRVSPVEKAKLKVLHSPAAAAAAASAAAAFAVSQSQEVISRTPSINGNATENTGVLLQALPEKSEDLKVEEITWQEKIQDSLKDDPMEDVSATPQEEKLSVTNELQLDFGAVQSEAAKLKQQLVVALQENSDLEKELVAVRGQLAGEQSRCFRLEVDVAELRQKLQAMDSLQKEVELLRRQKEAAEEAVVNAPQKLGTGVWGWLGRHQQDQKSMEV